MPKNKRVKVVALTQTQKKGRERKVALAEAVRDCTDKFSHAYVMQTVNMKTALMQSIRQDWKERGVFMHGKLKVLSLGVGVSPSTEAKPNMHKLSEHIGPDCLLFFTNEGPKEVAKYCEAWAFSDHARSGFECTSTFVLPKGQLPQFTFTQDEMLRKLGVPVSFVSIAAYLLCLLILL
jgi:mRNA turnover protein 4